MSATEPSSDVTEDEVAAFWTEFGGSPRMALRFATSFLAAFHVTRREDAR